jgi:hypothetical protein
MKPDFAIAVVLVQIQGAGFKVHATPVYRPGVLDRVDARSGKIDAVARARASGQGATVVVTLRSRRR